MKKFVFTYHDNWTEPTQEIMDAWMTWFGAIGESIVDGGNPFGPGKEFMRGAVKDLSPEQSPATGYTIVNAESMDAAIKLLEGCPILDDGSIHVYEAMSM